MVVEVGCGTGVFSVLAAQLGARHVYALEPTDLWTTARDVVAANGLQDRVTVLPLSVEAFAAAPPAGFPGADLVFSELLNADPFAEGLFEASAAGRTLLAPGGVLAPSRLVVQAALVQADAWQDLAAAQAQVARLAEAHGLDFGPVAEVVEQAAPEPFVAPRVVLRSAPVRLWDQDLTAAGGAPRPVTRWLQPDGPAPAGGVTVWFSADYGDGLVLTNAPQAAPSHWGHMVVALPEPVRGPVEVAFEAAEGSLEIGRR